MKRYRWWEFMVLGLLLRIIDLLQPDLGIKITAVICIIFSIILLILGVNDKMKKDEL